VAEIVLDNVSKRYPDGALAVDRFSLHVADGELVVLVGPSGCGKSTLLHMVAGLEDISEGTVTIGGQVVNDKAPKDRDIAMVFQSYALYPHMTVSQNMGFPLKLAGLDRTTIEQKVREAAALLELTAYLNAKPSTLSGGQRQRVAMGRAIVRRPKAFLMDEPLSNLDARLRVQMRREVARIQKTLGTTTLYVTHDQTEAMTLGDRVAVMQRGVLQQVGPPQFLYDHPANLFVAGFIGSPSMNFLPARLDGDLLHSPLGEGRIPDQLLDTVRKHPRGDVILGIRPEHFEDATLIDASDTPLIRADIEALESIGSDLFIYFRVPGAPVRFPELVAVGEAAAPDSASIQLVARLSAGSRAAEGEALDLCYDTNRIHLFDAKSGVNLTHGPPRPQGLGSISEDTV